MASGFSRTVAAEDAGTGRSVRFCGLKPTRPCVTVRIRASGNNSVVECDLAKVEVAGSNPVSRSIYYSGGPSPRLLSSKGAVAKW